MAIKRYFATADSTITNAYKPNLTTRAFDANMGLADSLEVFTIYGQESSTSREKERIVIKFPADTIKEDFDAGEFPDTAKFYLRLFNVEHTGTTPKDFNLEVYKLSKRFDEGTGLDMEDYTDDGVVNWLTASLDKIPASGSFTITTNPTAGAVFTASVGTYEVSTTAAATSNGTATNLETALNGNSNITSLVSISRNLNVVSLVALTSGSVGNSIAISIDPTGSDTTGALTGSGDSLAGGTDYTLWDTPGGDTTGSALGSAYFETGDEDMTVDITSEVLTWLTSSSNDKGLLIRHTTRVETEITQSYYTKKFSARGSEFFFSRPVLEVRWDSSEQDDRANFYSQSNLFAVGSTYNQNTLNLYNRVFGSLVDLRGDATLVPSASFYADADLTDQLTPESVTVTREATGSYKAIVELSTTASTVYEKWTHPTTSSIVFFSGSFDVRQRIASNTNKQNQYVINITNLQDKYSTDETARFRLFTRLKDWSPTIYTVANSDIETEIIKSAYYKVFRVVDNLDIIDFGTGSVEYTKLSYDKDGSYFDLDINMFEEGYAYGIQFSFFINGKYVDQPEVFKFRVE